MNNRLSRYAGIALLALATLLTACGGGSSSSSTVSGGPPPSPTEPDPEPPTPVVGEGSVRVLSNRADLISGGDALISHG